MSITPTLHILRRRRVQRAVLLLWLVRVGCALLAALPVGIGASLALSDDPRGDALLWEPGATYLLELWRLQHALTYTTLMTGLMLLIVGALLLAPALAYLVQSVSEATSLPSADAHSPQPATASSAPPPQATQIPQATQRPQATQGLEPRTTWVQSMQLTPSVLAVWLASVVCQGVLLLLGALFSGSLWSGLDRSVSEPLRDTLSLGPLLVSLGLCAGARVFADVVMLARTQRTNLVDALLFARRTFGDNLARLCGSWLVIQVLALGLLGSTQLLLEFTHLPSTSTLLTTGVYQLLLLLLCGLRSVWFATAAGSQPATPAFLG